MTSDVHHLVAMNQQVISGLRVRSLPQIHDVGMKLSCFKPRLFLSLPKDLQNHLKVMECWQIGQLKASVTWLWQRSNERSTIVEEKAMFFMALGCSSHLPS